MRRSSRPSSTARRSPNASAASRTPGPSARRSSRYYNHDHRHSGIGYHTPASVHYGTATEVRAQRAETLDAAYEANPARFRHRRPQPPKLPDVAWINEPVPVEEVAQKASYVSNRLTGSGLKVPVPIGRRLQRRGAWPPARSVTTPEGSA